MGWLRRLFFGRDLSDVLEETRTVFVQGVKFKIKKIDPMAYIEGSQVMHKHFDEYKVKPDAGMPNTEAIKKMRAHYRDVFLSSVVHPRLSRSLEGKQDGEIFVDYLMTDWPLATELYTQIILYSHGKKKLKRGISREQSLERSTL